MSMDWKGRKILITGATGLVGSWLVKALLKRKSIIVALVRDIDYQSEFYRSGDYLQTNIVNGLSVEKGVIRGMHFQFPPHSETKLVRVTNGKIYDVFIDLREGSPTFGQWDSINLSAENKKMIYIPRSLAHGFCTLTENCEILYKMDNYYALNSEASIRWNNPDLGIDWPANNPILSEKDLKAKSFTEFIEKYRGLEL